MITEQKIQAEGELLKLLRNKSREGISTLYDNYSPALYGVIFRIVNNKEIAEDILQEVFVKIWKNIASYDSAKGRLFTWMVNIARNLAIDQLRSKDFQKASKIQNLDNSVHYINKAYSSSGNTDHIGLKKIVEQLKPEYLIVIDMQYFKGYTQAEVAKELNIPLGTVKTRTRAALTELRKFIGV